MSNIGSHNTKFILGIESKFITQVRRVLNNYYDAAEVSDVIISDFLWATRSDYNYQTNSSVSDWNLQTDGLNYTVARVAALYIVIGLLSRSFSGGNMSYRLGDYEVDRKDTIDMVNVFKDMAERLAIKYGFHPTQGTILAELTTTEIESSEIIPEW
jgi:hypothetical protein